MVADVVADVGAARVGVTVGQWQGQFRTVMASNGGFPGLACLASHYKWRFFADKSGRRHDPLTIMNDRRQNQ